ncbi:restriction endonuclease subunit S [Providencia alcalifaciens]|uniref:restriction endonuclease subunit S n=1 Tax=Providencia alcalifaciens TaxID=126385 RepID=UPI003D99064C
MVPSGWVRHLGSEITTKITKGSSPKWQGFDYQSEGTLFITSENVRDGFLDVSKPKYLPLEFNQKLKNSQLQQGDILINIVGASIGRSCQYDLSEQQANINQAVCLFRTNELAESDFIQQYLQLPSTINRLLGTQSESARPNLSLSDMRDFLFALPPLPEQRKIAKILSTWDKAISTTEKLIATSQQQKKALMQQLLTGKKRLVNPDTGKVFEGEWEEVKLDDLALYRRGSFPQPYGNPEWVDEVNGYPFIQVFDIDKNMKLKKATKTKISDAAIDKSVFIEAGTVIVSLQGSIGRVAITQYDAYVDRTVLLFQSFKRKMDTIYFAYAIQELFEIEKEKAPGGTIKTITKQVLSNFTIKVPTHYEQQKIASVLTAADKEIELLQAKLAHLKDEKKALMQQLLTGKRRVKVDENVAA